MLNANRSSSSHSSIKTSSVASSSSSRFSVFSSFRGSYESVVKRPSMDSYQGIPKTPSFVGNAEDMDDDNVAWGPVSRKKRLS